MILFNFLIILLSIRFGVSENNITQRGYQCYTESSNHKQTTCKQGCIIKNIITIDLRGNQYITNSYHRMGCESYERNLLNIRCDFSLNRGFDYTIDYSFRSIHKDVVRLGFVHKKCCWGSYCNFVKHYSQPIKWFNHREIFKLDKFFIPQYALPIILLTFLVLFIISAILIILYIRQSYANDRLMDCYCDLEINLRNHNELVFESVIDTRLKITGVLGLRSTSEILCFINGENMDEKSEEQIMKEGEVVYSDKEKIKVETALLVYAGGIGHVLKRVERIYNTPYDILYKLIEHGPYRYPFTAFELLDLFEKATNMFSLDPCSLELTGDITVFGDMRGRYVDLHRWLQLTGWPPRNKILFIGGLVDSDESGSIECLALVCSLKLAFPKHVFYLRGATEVIPYSTSSRYHPKVCRALSFAARRMFSQLPFSAFINKNILAVYSGVSPYIKNRNQLRRLPRPALAYALTQVQTHFVFNQPSALVQMYRPHYKSRGDWYGRQAIKGVCKILNVSTVIRGHSPLTHGYMPCWKHRLINLWSAPGKDTKYGAVLFISSANVITPIIMRAQFN